MHMLNGYVVPTSPIQGPQPEGSGCAPAAFLKTFAAASKSEAREEVQETMLKYN